MTYFGGNHAGIIFGQILRFANFSAQTIIEIGLMSNKSHGLLKIYIIFHQLCLHEIISLA